MTTSRTSRKHRERRVIPPFGDGSRPHHMENLLNGVLAKCRFMPFKGGVFSAEPAYQMIASEIGMDIEPSFDLNLDRADEFISELGAKKDDLSLVVSARSGALKKYQALGQWTLDEVPPNPWSPKSEKLQSLQAYRTLDFIIAIRVRTNHAGLQKNGLEFGKILCRREFTVREPQDSGISFPFEWSEFGSGSRYPSEMLWAIHWLEPDEDRNPCHQPVKDALVVYGNKKVERALINLSAVSGARNLIWRTLACEIVSNIWETVIAKCIDELPDPDDDATLAGQVFGRIAQEEDISYDEIPDLLSEDRDNIRIRELVSRILKVVE